MEDKIKEILNSEGFQSLSAEEKKMALELASDSSAIEALWMINHKFRPISIEEFLTKKYIGESADHIYPTWKNNLIDVFDPKNSIMELIFSGATGTGKTTCAIFALMYILYWVTSLRLPARYFDMPSATPIIIACFSVTKEKAEFAHLDQIKQILSESSHFRKLVSKWEKDSLNVIANKDPSVVPYIEDGRRISFANNIHVMIGSRELHALSFSIICGFLDEAEFRKKGAGLSSIEDSLSLYTAVKNRIKNRFLGKTGYLSILVSSKRFQDSPIENYIKDVKEDEHTRIYSYSVWDVKDKKIYSGEKFKVFTGTKTIKPKIIDESVDSIEDLKKVIGSQILCVPIEYKSDAELNIFSFLRDSAGIATSNITPLFGNESDIVKIFDNKNVKNVSSVVKNNIDKYYLVNLMKEYFNKSMSGKYILHRASRERRYLHIDHSKNDNFTGLAMNHKERGLGDRIIYVWDFAFEIDPIGSDIDINLTAIEELIRFLYTDMNINFGAITFDQYRSAHAIEFCRNELKISKSIVREFSVDGCPDSYFLFRAKNYDNLVKIGYRQLLEIELKSLDEEGGKVVTRSTNDITDSVAGSFYNAYMDVDSKPECIYENENEGKSSEFQVIKEKVFVESKQSVYHQMDVFSIGK